MLRWLLEKGRLLSDLEIILEQLGERLTKAGAPVFRLRMGMRTVHPLIAASSAVWERESDQVTRNDATHGFETRSSYIGSPLEEISRTGQPFRKRIRDGLSDADHPVLHELQAMGATDYYGLPLRFAGGSGGILVFVGDSTEGFTGRDLDQFDLIGSAIAPIAEVIRLHILSRAVASAYLGRSTGQRVLDGQITRGHVDTIKAAILVSDIRGWTDLNARMPVQEAVTMANRYFETLDDCITAQRGEILKFMGDGVLAVFPADTTTPAEACESAMAAATAAQRAWREQAADTGLGFGIGLHFGDVLYGNIGSEQRLDFTVLGQAVNIAARIEALCGETGAPILCSGDVAGMISEPGPSLGARRLKGLNEPVEVFTAVGEPGT